MADTIWSISIMEEQGIDSELIDQMEQYIVDNGIRINSFILIRNGFMVEEKYFTPNSENSRRQIYSCTKSIISALVGITINEGYINGIDDRIFELLDINKTRLSDELMYDITLEDLLHMNSGLGAVDSTQIGIQIKPMDYILDLPMAAEPGESFLYTCAGPHLLSAAIQKATGVETGKYAAEKLLEPLGIYDVPWQKDKSGLSLGGAGLQLTPEEMARFGYLYLNNGVWNGEQIVPAKWVEESTTDLIDTGKPYIAESAGYGYLWWRNEFGGYSARGYGGQYIFILPEENLVAVFTSELYKSGFFGPYELMDRFLLPALS